MPARGGRVLKAAARLTPNNLPFPLVSANFALGRSAVPSIIIIIISNAFVLKSWLKIGFTYMLYCTFIYRTHLPFSDLCFSPAFVLQLSF